MKHIAAKWVVAPLGVLALQLSAQRTPPLERLAQVNVQVQEPSDMAIAHMDGPARFFVVSDNGWVALMDAEGRILRRSGEVAYDLEGALLHAGELMVVDERSRRVIWLDTATFQVKRRLTIPYAGGRNKGYEALVWHPLKQRFLLVTERDPVTIFELDSEMRVVNEMEFDRSIRDVSSGAWHEGALWLLSDMDRLLLRCDPVDYTILDRWTVPIINPEGMAFGRDGHIYIVSDDRQRLYTFRIPK